MKLPRGSGSWGERLASLAGIDPGRAALLGQVGRGAARAVDAVQPHLRTARELRDRWAGHPLFFLLRRLPVPQVAQLLRLVDESGDEIVVELAAPVLTGSALVQIVHEELVFVGDLAPQVRRQLVHGLRHAEAGEWEDACPPLVVALQHVARNDASRAREQRRSGERLPGPRTATPSLPAALELARPLASRSRPVLVKAGSWVRDAIAQGRSSQTYQIEGDARRQAVFLTAELVRWLERSGQQASTQLLVRELATAIRQERERRQPAARQLRRAARREALDTANDRELPTSES